jgi:flagellin FlaA/flagellin FlaB
VQVVSAFGTVSNDEKVTDISLTVMRGSGSDDINLSAATIEWIGPKDAKTLTHDADNDKAGGDSETGPAHDEFTVSKIKDPDKSDPVLNTQDDRLEIKIDAKKIGDYVGDQDATNGDYLGLDEGTNVKLKLTTQYGAVTLYRVNVPQSLSQESAVTV